MISKKYLVRDCTVYSFPFPSFRSSTDFTLELQFPSLYGRGGRGRV